MTNLLELQNRIHKQNVEMGWWDNPRPFSTFVCLFHSELSEAMEGDRKNLMDDHLTQHPMFQVELADFVIRCLDWLGSKGNTRFEFFVMGNTTDNLEFLADMHAQTSSAYNLSKDPFYSKEDRYVGNIGYAVVACFEFAKRTGFDLPKIIEEKIAYNAIRADHKRENRAKEGGKKY